MMGIAQVFPDSAWYYDRLAAAFLIWAALWAFLIFSRRVQFSLRVLFIIVTGFAVLAAIAGCFIRSLRTF
jgi:hypothetical protein